MKIVIINKIMKMKMKRKKKIITIIIMIIIIKMMRKKKEVQKVVKMHLTMITDHSQINKKIKKNN